jgi:transcriptional regulator with XRE-family HTH domain
MELGGMIRKYREALGLSQAELGKAVGVSQATIDKIENGRTALSRFLPRIAARLGIPLKQLDPLIEVQQRQPGQQESDAAGPPEHRSSRGAAREEEPRNRAAMSPMSFSPRTVESRHEMLRLDAAAPAESRPALAPDEADLPVYVANVDAFPIDRVKRPPPLANVRGAYGLLIKDPAMEPEFWPGDIALVHPHLPPLPQSACVFKTETPPGGERSQIKHLVSFDNATWRVRQWNPPQGTKGEFTLSRKEWPVCHRVVGKYSRG